MSDQPVRSCPKCHEELHYNDFKVHMQSQHYACYSCFLWFSSFESRKAHMVNCISKGQDKRNENIIPSKRSEIIDNIIDSEIIDENYTENITNGSSEIVDENYVDEPEIYDENYIDTNESEMIGKKYALKK